MRDSAPATPTTAGISSARATIDGVAGARADLGHEGQHLVARQADGLGRRKIVRDDDARLARLGHDGGGCRR